MKTWELVFAALVVVLNLQSHVHGVPQVPCYFIFGDSLADNGNNNLLQTKAKANYPPYGIDFPNGPTGRFTNGLTTFDMIGLSLSKQGFMFSLLFYYYFFFLLCFMLEICTYMPIANFLSTAQLLGFDKLIPPFATANDSDILQGVNYASGAAGIRQETGNHMVIIWSINFLILNWYIDAYI